MKILTVITGDLGSGKSTMACAPGLNVSHPPVEIYNQDQFQKELTILMAAESGTRITLACNGFTPEVFLSTQDNVILYNVHTSRVPSLP